MDEKILYDALLRIGDNLGEREMESFEFAFRNGELSIEECSRRLLVNRNPLLVIH